MSQITRGRESPNQSRVRRVGVCVHDWREVEVDEVGEVGGGSEGATEAARLAERVVTILMTAGVSVSGFCFLEILRWWVLVLCVGSVWSDLLQALLAGVETVWCWVRGDVIRRFGG